MTASAGTTSSAGSSSAPPAGHHDESAFRSGVAAGLTAFVAWGLLTLYWKQLTAFEPFELVGWRIVSASVVMAVIVSVTRRWGVVRSVVRDRTLLLRVLAAALLLSVNWTTYVWAVVNGHVLDTALGYFLGPLGTIAIGVLFFGEQLRSLQRVAVGFAVAAVLVLTVGYGRFPVVAVLLATSWMLYGVLKKQVPLTPVDSMAAEAFLLVIPAIIVVTVFAGRPGSVPSTASAVDAVLVALTGVATVVPLMLFAWAAQRVPLTLLGPMQYLIPTINFLIGWLVYHEEMVTSRWIGFLLVWAALVLITVDTVRTQRSRGQSPVVTAA